MWTILAALVVFGILLLAEYLARTTAIHSELTRKFVHMSVGTFVAFWPFFLSWHAIEFMSMSFFIVVAISIRLNIFRSIHAVKRGVSGELLFAIAIGVLALISGSKWIFMAGMLNLSLGDSAAAIVGTLWGDNRQYKVFGHAKSVAGSTAFFIVSEIVFIFFIALSHASLGAAAYIWVPAAATAAENLAVNGTDNVVVPLLVALLLSNSL